MQIYAFVSRNNKERTYSHVLRDLIVISIIVTRRPASMEYFLWLPSTVLISFAVVVSYCGQQNIYLYIHVSLRRYASEF